MCNAVSKLDYRLIYWFYELNCLPHATQLLHLSLTDNSFFSRAKSECYRKENARNTDVKFMLVITRVKNPTAKWKNLFSFSYIWETSGPKTIKFWKSVFLKDMNPLTKLKRMVPCPRNDLADRRWLTLKYVWA